MIRDLVKTIFIADDRHFNRTVGRMSMRATALRSALNSAFAFGGLAGGLGAFGLVRGLVRANSSLETMQLNMASMMLSADKIVGGPIKTFAAAFEASSQVIKDARELAIQSPATASNITASYNEIGIMARQTGASYREILQLSRDIAARDVLGGGVGGGVARDVSQLLKGSGVSAAEIQTPQLRAAIAEIKAAKDPAKKLSVIQRALALSEAELEAFGNSWGGVMATAQDALEEAARTAGKPVFNLLKTEIQSAAKWMRENRQEVEKYAMILGGAVVDGARALVSVLKFALDYKDELVFGFKVLATVWIGTHLINGLSAIIALAPTLAAALTVAFGPIGIALAGIGGIALAIRELTTSNDAHDDLREAGVSVPEAAALVIGMKNGGPLGGLLELDRVQRSRASDLAAWKTFVGPEWDPVADAQNRLLNQRVNPHYNIDARGARITLNQQIDTNDPGRIAGESLRDAFTAVASRPLTGTLGLGALPLVN